MQRRCHLLKLVGETSERGAGELDEVCLADHGHRGRARLMAEQGHLAKHRVLTKLRQVALATQPVGIEDPHATGGDQKEALPRLAFADRELAIGHAAHDQGREHPAKGGLAQAGEQGNRVQGFWEFRKAIGAGGSANGGQPNQIRGRTCLQVGSGSLGTRLRQVDARGKFPDERAFRAVVHDQTGEQVLGRIAVALENLRDDQRAQWVPGLHRVPGGRPKDLAGRLYLTESGHAVGDAYARFVIERMGRHNRVVDLQGW